MVDQDHDIIRRVQAGERKAYEMIVAKYHDPIFNLALRLVGDYDNAVDITQQSFVAAYEKLNQYNPSYRFFSWLYRIAYNGALKHIQLSKRNVDLDHDLRSERATPEEDALRSEQEQFIRRGLQGVEFEYRVVLVMKHFQGLSYREIVEILEISESTLKYRLYRARKMMREQLEKLGYLA